VWVGWSGRGVGDTERNQHSLPLTRSDCKPWEALSGHEASAGNRKRLLLECPSAECPSSESAVDGDGGGVFVGNEEVLGSEKGRSGDGRTSGEVSIVVAKGVQRRARGSATRSDIKDLYTGIVASGHQQMFTSVAP
jgi:hypothetical protein